MVGVTLVEIREHIESLASESGDYALLCARTGERPFPVSGKRFEERATARAAARATEQYRAALRRYDPRLPCHDVVVREETGPLHGPDRGEPARSPGASWTLSSPVVTAPGDDPAGQLVEFCHGVAAAVFEALSERGAGEVEQAVMAAYLDRAEEIADPDRLCLCLLESMAGELAAGLDPTAQAAVLSAAADRLPAPARTGHAVVATLSRLRRLGLLGRYSTTSPPTSTDATPGTIVARLTEYALSPRGQRLPTLPVVVDLARRQPDRPPSRLAVRAIEGGWRVTIEFGPGRGPGNLASVPIRTE